MSKDNVSESLSKRGGSLNPGVNSSDSLQASTLESVGKPTTAPLDTNNIALCAGLDCKGLELIINWVSSTVYTINPDDEALLRLCQTVILKQALSHKFLMHGLLAVSALHLADQRGNDWGSYSRIAMSHHNEGLTMFRAELRSIKASNYSAAIAFSSVTTIFSFALSRPLQETSLSLLDDLAQIFQLAKGWHEIVRVADNLELKGPANTDSQSQPKTGFSISADARHAFSHLHELNSTSVWQDGEHEGEVYAEVIDSLDHVYGKSVNGNSNPHMALEWVNMLPSRFFCLLKEHRTLALLVLGHYCVILDRFKHLWWLKGWSSGLLKVIWHKVDPVNRNSLAWPVEMAGLSDLDM